jgi:HD-like signal output (HDOD) protein
MTHNIQAADEFAARVGADIERAVAEGRMAWPSIPEVLLRIREAMQREDADARRIADAVGTDPVLSARFIRMANSVHYGSNNACHTLRDAVVRLGQGAVEQVATMLVVSRVFAVGKRKRLSLHLRRLWTHSVKASALCQVLSELDRGLKPDVAALAGLIHDIGVVPVLVHASGFEGLLEKRHVMEPLVHRLHAQLGPSVLHDWNFPPELMQVVRAHESEPLPGRTRADYVDLVHLANALCRLNLDCEAEVAALCATPAAHVLALSPEALPALLERAGERADSMHGAFK